MFFIGQTIKALFKEKYVSAVITKVVSRETFVLSWEYPGKNFKEKYNKLYKKEELEKIISGRENLTTDCKY